MGKTFGLIGAMDEEIELFLDHMKDVRLHEKAGIVFREGEFLGKRVVLCKSGVGKVNAAVCTQMLIDRFAVDAVIFTGVAGALDPVLNIGDIVVSVDCMQHDMDASVLGFPKGTIPFAAKSLFAADLQLAERAFSSSEKLFPGRTKKGRVLSGDQFIANRDIVKQLHEQMEGACTEMEGGAVAQVCSMNGVPFVVIRSMSDKADGSAHVNFTEFALQASRNSYRIVEDMLRQL